MARIIVKGDHRKKDRKGGAFEGRKKEVRVEGVEGVEGGGEGEK